MKRKASDIVSGIIVALLMAIMILMLASGVAFAGRLLCWAVMS